MITAIDAGPAGRIELGILDVKGPYALVVDIDEIKIIHRLKHEVRGIIKDVGAGMIAGRLQKTLEGNAVMQVFAGMQLVAEIDAILLECIENGRPALAEFSKGHFDKTCGALRPGINERPRQRAGKTRMALEAQMLRGFRRALQLVDRPFLTRLRSAAQFGGRKTVEHLVIGRMNSDELALNMG
ncbi:hypothetical protein D3C87_1673240 [compost metagenome]